MTPKCFRRICLRDRDLWIAHASNESTGNLGWVSELWPWTTLWWITPLWLLISTREKFTSEPRSEREQEDLVLILKEKNGTCFIGTREGFWSFHQPNEYWISYFHSSRGEKGLEGKLKDWHQRQMLHRPKNSWFGTPETIHKRDGTLTNGPKWGTENPRYLQASNANVWPAYVDPIF